MAFGLLALQNGKQVVFPNSHLYKMATLEGQQTISVTSRPFKSFEAIFEHASPIFTMFFFLFLCYFWILAVDSGGVRVASAGQMAGLLYGCGLPGDYKMTTQPPLQNRSLGPRVVFQLTTLQNHNSTTYKQKQHAPTQRTHSRCWTTRLWGKDLHHVPLPKNARTRHCQLRSIKLFSLQNEPPQ